VTNSLDPDSLVPDSLLPDSSLQDSSLPDRYPIVSVLVFALLLQ